MFSLSKNEKRKEQQSQNSFHDKAAATIVKGCIRVQTKWADFMLGKTKGLSRKAKIYSLLFFCLLSVMSSLYLVIISFIGTLKQRHGVTPINVPIHSTQTGE